MDNPHHRKSSNLKHSNVTSSIVVDTHRRSKHSSLSVQSEGCLKIKINKRMIDLKELVRLCNQHCV